MTVPVRESRTKRKSTQKDKRRLLLAGHSKRCGSMRATALHCIKKMPVSQSKRKC